MLQIQGVINTGIKTAAIIAEYNPFHSGHMHHITETRRIFGATHIVAVMSGSFVQRGDCACASKFVRARMALLGGADLVLELPVPWALSGAERFALGGVALAESLGCVDILSFGSESGSIDRIINAAAAVDSDEIKSALHSGLANGESFARARTRAAQSLSPDLADALRSPNDTLGVEYCRAITTLSSSIKPVCVKRIGAAHDSMTADSHVSASFIREKLTAGKGIEHIPEDVRPPLDEAIASGYAPSLISRLDRAILYRLRQMNIEQIAALPDISEGLENRIYRCIQTATSFDELCSSIKTKRYTHARIRRIVISALLGLTSQDSAGTPPYLRVLGMNQRGREILRMSSPTLPVITRYADLEMLGERARRTFELEAFASDVLALATPKAGCCGTDMTEKLIVL